MNMLNRFLYISSVVFFVCLHAETDESKAIAAYIQAHIKNPSTPIPEKIKNRTADITVLEDFVRSAIVSVDKIPAVIIEKSKDLIFRQALLSLISELKIKIVSDDKTIESIIQKLNEKDVYSYLSAKIDFMLANNEAFASTIKSASQDVKDFTLLELLLNTASQFGTIQEFQKSSDFKKNETFIKLTTDAGAKINTAITKLQTLGLTTEQQETFINALFAPHFDFIEFLIKNGLDKNLTLPAIGTQKKRTLVEFYEDQLKAVTEKLANVVSTDLKNIQEDTSKILALIKPKETKPNSNKAPKK